MLFASGPSDSPQYGDVIGKIISGFEKPREARVACPYVTENGVEQFCSDSSGQDWTENCPSIWIVGLNQGVTQPSALRELYEKDQTEVRIFSPRAELSKTNLHRSPFLHAKTALIHSESSPEQRALLATSANMTGAAIGNTPTNYELGYLTGNSRLRDESVHEFYSWWNELETQSILISEALIQEYEEIRRNSSFAKSADTSSDAIAVTDDIQEAKYFWIFSGTLSSGSRHQLDLKKELASFFGDLHDEFFIDIIINGRRYDDNKVIHRKKQHKVDQWRFHLPTRSDGFDLHADDNEFYCNKYLLFERIPEENVFILRIRGEDSPEVENWKDSASRFGMVDKTGSLGSDTQKEYGFY